MEVYEFLGAERRPAPGPGRVPRARDQARAAQQAPAGDERLGVAHRRPSSRSRRFVEEGLSNPEIAARLMLSRRTVATHVSHILKKLDVATRTDIARESALRTLAPR